MKHLIDIANIIVMLHYLAAFEWDHGKQFFYIHIIQLLVFILSCAALLVTNGLVIIQIDSCLLYLLHEAYSILVASHICVNAH